MNSTLYKAVVFAVCLALLATTGVVAATGPSSPAFQDATETGVPTETETATETGTPAETEMPTETALPTEEPTATASEAPTDPAPTETSTEPPATETPSASPTEVPSATPTALAAATATAEVTAPEAESVSPAASGGLDTNFSGDGKVIANFGGIGGRGWDVVVQADGKVIVVGEKLLNTGSDFAIARYKANGALDTTFSGDGKQTVNIGTLDQAIGVAIQTNGKIVVGGQTCNADGLACDVAIVRLTANGSLDLTFGGGDGIVTTDFGAADNGGFDLALAGTKIVVGGYLHDGASYNGAVYRYLASGDLDVTFSSDGILPINFGQDDLFRGVLVASGKIYVTGTSGPALSPNDIIAARINSNGTLDTAFSGDGKVKTNLGGAEGALELVLDGGKLIVVGFSDSNLAIVRYKANGGLDTTFSGDGIVKTNLGLPSPRLHGVVMQGSKILAIGTSDGVNGNALVVRYNSNGSLDTSFSGDGIVMTNWGGNDRYESLFFGNSKIYAVGRIFISFSEGKFILARYLP